MAPKRFRSEQCRAERRSTRSINVFERCDEALTATGGSDAQRRSVYCGRARAKLEILVNSLRRFLEQRLGTRGGAASVCRNQALEFLDPVDDVDFLG